MKTVELDLIKMAERWQRYGDNYRTEARTYWTEMTKTSLTVSTFLIGFIGIFIQISDFSCQQLINKLFISISFVSLVLSIILGVVTLIMMNGFINNGASYYEKLSENTMDWMLKNNKDFVKEEPDEIAKGLKFPIWNGAWITIVQLSLLSLGVVAIMFYLFMLIY